MTVTDEPRGRVQQVLDACDVLARCAPQLKPKSAFKSCPGGYEFTYAGHIREWGYQPRIWSPDPVGKMVAFNREREAAGEKVFWYIHAFLPIAAEAYLHRMFFWALRKYQVRGAMLYSTCEWDYSEVDRCLDDFVISSRVDGAGTLLWPGEGRFLDSVRRETIRDGIGDSDLARLLEARTAELAAKEPGSALLEEARAALADTDSVFRALERPEEAAGYALKLNAGGGPTWAAVNRPQDLYGARERIARLAEKVEARLGAAR
ncbi:MAG: hypothetical protein AAB576_00220 [Elusimicrobiota bacterium]